jgi:hypothetical protein
MILTGVGVAVTLLIIAAADGASLTFELGWRTIFEPSAALLLPLTQLLVVAALAVRGHLVDPANDPIGSAGRFAALLVLGHAVGMGIGLSQYDGDMVQAELVTALLAGIGLAIAGFAWIVGVMVDRVRPPGAWHRYGVPLLFGLGSGMVLLLTQVDSNSTFYVIFRGGGDNVPDLGRYLGFTVGAAIVPIVTVVVAALIARSAGARGAGTGARRVVTAASALALVVAGVTVTAQAANLLS